MNSSPTTYTCSVKCISWSAIFVGSIVGVGLGFLLNLFSVAIGLSAFTTSPEGVTAFAIGGFIGFAIGVFVSMFVAGWVAGHLGKSHCPKRNSGALYGFTTWSMALILVVLLSGPVGHYVAAGTGFISNSAPAMMHRPMMDNGPAAEAAPDGQQPPAPPAEKAANDAGKAAFALFILFFLGAIGACFGGHWGMVCCKEDECCTTSSSSTSSSGKMR
jgi:hypothetical protein